MIGIDANTLLALLAPAGTALLALILVMVDMARPGRDRLLVAFGVGGLVILMALVVVIGPLPGLGLLNGPQEVFALAHRAVFFQYFEVLADFETILFFSPFVKRDMKGQASLSKVIPRINTPRNRTERHLRQPDIVSAGK